MLALIKAGRKRELIVSGTYKPLHCYSLKATRDGLPTQITVLAVKPLDGGGCQLRFVLGDHTDQPRLLKARPGGHEGDYTCQPTLAMRAEAEAVSADWLDRFAQMAQEKRENGLLSRREHWAKVLATQRRQMASEGLGAPRAARLLKAAEEDLMRYTPPQPMGTATVADATSQPPP